MRTFIVVFLQNPCNKDFISVCRWIDTLKGMCIFFYETFLKLLFCGHTWHRFCVYMLFYSLLHWSLPYSWNKRSGGFIHSSVAVSRVLCCTVCSVLNCFLVLVCTSEKHSLSVIIMVTKVWLSASHGSQGVTQSHTHMIGHTKVFCIRSIVLDSNIN